MMGINHNPIMSREDELFLELLRLGVDIRRLAFWRWLVAHGRNPEWSVPARARLCPPSQYAPAPPHAPS